MDKAWKEEGSDRIGCDVVEAPTNENSKNKSLIKLVSNDTTGAFNQ